MDKALLWDYVLLLEHLIPPIIAGDNLFSTTAGILTIVGVSITVAGIAVIGYAGSLKSKEMTEEEKKAAVKEFALKKGILIAIFAGMMSACFNFGFESAKPIEIVALAHGTNPLFQKNPSLIFILFGGFITNLIYCGYLNIKNKTYRDYYTVSGSVLLNNLFFTFLAGFLWFLQFHFFGMGSSKLPEGMAVFGWSILMALNIAISNIWGIFLNEWKGVKQKNNYCIINWYINSYTFNICCKIRIKNMETKRFGFKMKMLPGFKEEYRKRHNEIWPELVQLLKNEGIGNYSIFLDEETNTFLLTRNNQVKVPPRILGNTEIVKKWWKYMSDIMETNPDNSPVTIPLEQVFYME